MNVPLGITTEEGWNEVKDYLRPVMVSLISCKNVWLNGDLPELSSLEYPSFNVRECTY